MTGGKRHTGWRTVAVTRASARRILFVAGVVGAASIVAGVVGAASIAAGLHMHRITLEARLLRTLPDDAPNDPVLVRFAAAQAPRAYQAHCAACHGADMAGDPARGAPNLTDADWLYGSGRVSEIEQTLRYGIRSADRRARNVADMPAYGDDRPYWRFALPTLTAAQISDVTQYVRQLGGLRVDAEAAGRGRAVYSGAAQCYDCHTPDGRGDSYIGAPNLADRIWQYGDGSPRAIAQSIAGGHAGVCPAWQDRLAPGTIRALALYLHNRSAKGQALASR